MFNTPISTPVHPLTNEYIEQLKKPTGERDLALTMLGLAVFKGRIQNYEGMTGNICTATDAWMSVQKVVNDFDSLTPDSVAYYYTVCSRAIEATNFDGLTALGFKHKETVENLMKTKFGSDTIVLYHEEKNVVAIWTQRNSMDTYHLLMSFLPLYYPAIFTKPLTRQDPEVDLFTSLSQNRPDRFIQELSKAFEPYKKEFIHTQISLIVRGIREGEIETARQAVEAAKAEMEDSLNVYVNRVNAHRESMIRYEGLRNIEQNLEQENTLIEYLCSTPNIRNVNLYNRTTIDFIATSYLTQYDLDTWEQFDHNGTIYDGDYEGYRLSGAFANKDNRKLLLQAIFAEDPKFKVKMCGYYKLDMVRKNVRTNQGYDYVSVDPLYKDYIPNPHLQRYACLGDYQTVIARTLANGDLLTAVELCIASAGSVNLDETYQNFRPLLGAILTSQNKVLTRFDGVDMTPEEALLWLLEEKEKAE